ncbi:cupin domain-containing protein [Chitinilyticum litopenaei]|uniref:cupin domain-containing protein n=1 Tax=Chitinilyticum litopenaei TaxID=1121276 RepID=UPI0005BB8445|nr:cupin domain-containing protein [Chitinilyticum litopenaei]
MNQKIFNLDDMLKGWFVGNFKPTAFETKAAEVGIKTYAAGEKEAKHYHKISTELTVVIDGTILMNGQTYEKGDIIVIPPGNATDFEAITDARTVVVKVPGELNDKYLVD